MKSPSLTFVLVSGIMVVSLMLVSPKPSRASSSTTTSLGMSIRTIAESNTELEFMMGSDFGRMLASYPGYYNKVMPPPVYPCGRGQRYCLPPINPTGGPRCNPYNRNCHQ